MKVPCDNCQASHGACDRCGRQEGVRVILWADTEGLICPDCIVGFTTLIHDYMASGSFVDVPDYLPAEWNQQ